MTYHFKLNNAGWLIFSKDGKKWSKGKHGTELPLKKGYLLILDYTQEDNIRWEIGSSKHADSMYPTMIIPVEGNDTKAVYSITV